MKEEAIGWSSTPWDRDAVESRYAYRVAAVLSQASSAVPHDVSERLRVARTRALESGRWAQQAKPVRAQATQVHAASGTVALGGEPGWGWRLASLVPVLALVAGLVLIQEQSDGDQIRAAADIDAALLSDDLPPDAYTDVGFAEYLRKQER